MKITETMRLNPLDQERFKNQSLELYAEQMAIDGPFDSYPELESRFFANGQNEQPSEAILQPGTWWTKDRQAIVDSGDYGLHPWFNEMVTIQAIGALAGRGSYWNFGENHSADPIIVRHDLQEPHVLTVLRGDNGRLAFPGGFINQDETEFAAGIREGREETGIDISKLEIEKTEKIYQGPVADPRMTAHAWGVTHAIRFDLAPKSTEGMPVGPWAGKDDAKQAGWKTVDEFLSLPAHGSHPLLCRLAFGE